MDNNVRQCKECKSTFIRQSDLIRHIKRFHKKIAEKLIDQSENQDRRFKCNQCNKRFFHRRNLQFHENSHEVNDSGVKIRKKCPFCDHISFFKKEFYDHCQAVHNIAITFDKLDFVTVDDFTNWKLDIEKSSNCEFVKEYGSTPKISNFVCNRSQIEDSTDSEDKIDGFCPAGFKITYEDSGGCSVLFVKTHICQQGKCTNSNIDNDKEIKSKPTKTTPQRVKKVTKAAKTEEKPKNGEANQVKDVSQSDTKISKKLPKITNIPKKKSFLTKKKDMIQSILSTLNSVSNMGELDAVQELLKPIPPVLQILRKKSSHTKRTLEIKEKS